MILRTIAIGVIMGATFLMSGCASKNMQAKNSGFFEDYSELKKQTELKPDFYKYKKIIVAPVQVISAITPEEQTEAQKKLYKEISEYLNAQYKKEIQSAGKYTVTDNEYPDAMILQTAVSTVEVHFDDDKWNQFTPTPMGVNVVSFNAYMDEDVRILGEKRLVDSETKKVLARSMSIQKDVKIILSAEHLEFKNVKPALDSWLAQIKKDFSK